MSQPTARAKGSTDSGAGSFAAQTNTVMHFAGLLEREQRERLRREYPSLNIDTDQYRVAVKPGPKYTRVDFGGSGKYMVVNATGEIFGIKAYGVIHHGHRYGTLDTITQYNWGGYSAVPAPQAHPQEGA